MFDSTMTFYSRPFGINLQIKKNRLYVKSSLWRDVRPGSRFKSMQENAKGKEKDRGDIMDLSQMDAARVQSLLRDAQLPLTLSFSLEAELESGDSQDAWEKDAENVKKGMGVFDITDEERAKWDPDHEDGQGEGEKDEEVDFWPNDKNWWKKGKQQMRKEVPADEDKKQVELFLKQVAKRLPGVEDYADFFPSMSQLAHMKRKDLKRLEIPIKQRQAILHELEHFRQVQNMIKFGPYPYDFPNGRSQYPGPYQSYGEAPYRKYGHNKTDSDTLMKRIPKNKFRHFAGVYGESPHNVPTKEGMLLEKWSKVLDRHGQGFKNPDDFDRVVSGKEIYHRKRAYPVNF